MLEDVHWADEATLDVVRSCSVAGWKGFPPSSSSATGDELDRAHPLRIVLGELSTSQAVEAAEGRAALAAGGGPLAEPHGVDAEELYRKTEGNPFFVTEVLAAGDAEIPDTVRDAVLARAARLSPAARALLEAVAVVPPRVELWLLETLAAEALDQLDECLDLRDAERRDPDGVTSATSSRAWRSRSRCRRTGASSCIGRRSRRSRHPPAGAPDLARLAHHAEAAGDAEAVLAFAPRGGSARGFARRAPGSCRPVRAGAPFR